MPRFSLILIHALACISAFGRESALPTDSLGVAASPAPTAAEAPPPLLWEMRPLMPDFGGGLAVPESQLLRPLPGAFSYSFPQRPDLARWDTGSLRADGSTDVMPGMMQIDAGRLSLGQQWDKVSVTAYAEALKYGYMGGLSTSWGLGGDITYRLGDRWSVTAYGSWYTPASVATPGQLGYVAVPQFGGYVDYRISSRFGVQVGARAYRSLVRQGMEVVPTVVPYIRLNERHVIGVDVGGIVYQLLRSAGMGVSSRPANPTIGPPVP